MDPQASKTAAQQANSQPVISRKPVSGALVTGAPVATTPAHRVTGTSSTASTLATRPRWWQTAAPQDSLLSFILKWACTVLTVAASLVFGIWAPLSYQATIDSNSGSSAAQNSALSLASAAYAEATVQGSALADVQARVGAMGQLVLIEFCATQTAVPACTDVINAFFGSSQASFQSLASYLVPTLPGEISSTTTTEFTSTTFNNPPTTASTYTMSTISSEFTSATPSASATSASSSSAAPTSGGSSHGSALSGHLSVPAILAIVFAVVVFIGAVAGCLYIWQYRRRRMKSSREETTTLTQQQQQPGKY